MRVLLLVHEVAVGSGAFAQEISGCGHEIEEWIPSRARLARPLAQYDALIAFGGTVHADQEDLHPWLRTVLRLLRDALDSGLPTLGVCLGGQLLARVAGGTVRAAPRAEWGWHAIELTDAAVDDPLLGGLPSILEVFQWHFERFTLPPGAVALAHSAVGLQAFRVGASAWGVQWHPEVTAETVMLWGEQYPPRSGGVPVEVDLAQLRADIEARLPRTSGGGRALCTRFLQVAADRARRKQAVGRSGSI